MKIILNPDKQFVEDMRKSLKETSGYCPCRLERTPATKCKCEEFRKQIENGVTGWCHCGLYYAEEDENT